MFKRYLYQNYRVFYAVKSRFSRRLTRGGWLVLAAFFVSAILGLDTNLSMSYQVFAFLFCLVLVAFVSLWIARPRFAAERRLPRFGSAGEPIHYQIELVNRSRFTQNGLTVLEESADPRPSFQQFLDTPEPGEARRNWYDRTNGYYRWSWLIERNQRAQLEEQPVPALPGRGRIQIDAVLTPRRRGRLRLEGITVLCPDPFGLFRAFRRVSLPQSLLVLPKRYVIPHFELPGKMQYQHGGVALASAVGESEEFVSLRDYRPGDSLRRIHWKSWAKTGKPIVKEFQDEFFVRHALILDTFSSIAQSEVFEEAVSVAASFACTIRTQDSLLDLMFVGPQAFCFTAGRGVAQTEQILEILAAVEICRDKPFRALQQLVMEHVASVSGCICIFLEWDEERQKFVEDLLILGMPVMVFVMTASQATTPVDPGPLAARPGSFRVLPAGKIAEALVQL